MKKTKKGLQKKKTSITDDKSPSVDSKLEKIDEELNSLKAPEETPPPDETVKAFLKKWEELCYEYGYHELMEIDVFLANHPFLDPSLPIQVMDKETYMNLHYESIHQWRRSPKLPTKLQVIETKRTAAIEGINISGPLNEYPLFQAFIGICEFTNTLQVLKLIGCLLTTEGIMMLAQCLPRTPVTHLYLDRNPIADEDYSSLLDDNMILVHLSLAMCNIGLKGIKALSEVLGPYKGPGPNQCLKSLVLDNNRIDCLAMKTLSECLRWNRELAHLSLAGNLIGSQGIIYLSSIFYTGKMTRGEIWEMNCRQIDRIRKLEEIVNEELQLPIVEVENGKIDIYEEDKDGLLKNLADSDIMHTDVDPIRMKVLEKSCEEFLELDPNPIVRDVTLHNGKLISTGNYTLHTLNISYNKIGEHGFLHLLKALRKQKEAALIRRDTRKNKYHLKSIEYLGNPCPEDNILFHKIAYYLRISNEDKYIYHSTKKPCSCLPTIRQKLDPDTLLVYNEGVDYFKPKIEEEEEEEEKKESTKSSKSSEIMEELVCCNEYATDIDDESLLGEGEDDDSSETLVIEQLEYESDNNLDDLNNECEVSTNSVEDEEDK